VKSAFYPQPPAIWKHELGLDTKSQIFLGFLEHQEIFQKFWGFLEKNGICGGFLDDFEEKLFYFLCRFI